MYTAGKNRLQHSCRLTELFLGKMHFVQKLNEFFKSCSGSTLPWKRHHRRGAGMEKQSSMTTELSASFPPTRWSMLGSDCLQAEKKNAADLTFWAQLLLAANIYIFFQQLYKQAKGSNSNYLCKDCTWSFAVQQNVTAIHQRNCL